MRTVGVKLIADISGYTSNIKRAGEQTKSFTSGLDAAAKGGQLDAVADQAGMAGLALVGMAAYAVNAAAQFDKSMSAVKAATHASAGEIDQLREAALKAGKETQYSATEAANAITELSKAGVATADVLNGGLKGALNLAAAGQLDVAEAAETAATALVQFKLKGSDVPHVADLLAAGAGKAQGSVHDMGMALNQAGLIASQTGLTIEETTGALGAFANAGLIGSDAGTSFKQMLLMLQAPSDATQKVMDKMGITLYDSQGQFMGLTKFAGQLRNSLKDLTPEMRQSTLATIFGADATRAASIVYENGAEGIQTWIDKVNDQGYAQKTAADLTDNLAGDIERLKGALETLAIEAGSGANGGIRALVQMLNTLVDQFSRMPGWVGGTATALAGILGVLALALAAFIKLRGGVRDAVEELNKMGPAGERAATGLQRAAGMAAKAGAAFAALEVAAAVFNSLATKTADVDRLTASLDNLGKTGKSAGELKNVFGEGFDKLGQIAKFADSANNGYGKFVNGVADSIPFLGDAGKAIGNFGTRLIAGTDFETAKQQMASLDQAMTNYATTTNDAEKASQMWQQVVAESGIPIDHLIQLLPNAYKKIGELNTAAMKSRDAMGSATGATKGYADSAEAAAAAAEQHRVAMVDLAKALKAETDPVFALIDAQNTLTKAQKDAAKAVKDHGRNSAEAKEATRKLAEAAVDLQGKASGLAAGFDGKLSPSLRNTFRQAGLTKGQIRDIEKQFGTARRAGNQFAKTYGARVTLTGADEAAARVKRVRDLLAQVRSKKISVTVLVRDSQLQKVNKQLGEGAFRAEGGPVRKGQAYIVGEKQAEVFVPDQNGTIVPSISQYQGMDAGGAVAQPMPSMGGTTTVVHEHHLVIEGRGALGRTIVAEMRDQPGLSKTLKTLIATA